MTSRPLTSTRAGRTKVTEFVTIGVYGWDARRSSVRCRDAAGRYVVRHPPTARRARSEYAFANSQRLQARLAELGIAYVHRLDLAPGDATRQAQYAVDEASKTAKRQRQVISPAFADAYRQECLAGFDSQQFVADLGDVRVVALLCVERDAAACHRSLLTDQLAHDLDISVTHLLTASISPAESSKSSSPAHSCIRGEGTFVDGNHRQGRDPMKVLIVAKTRQGGGACIGGITFDGRSVRLIAADAASNERPGLEYEVGEVWEIERARPTSSSRRTSRTSWCATSAGWGR